MKNGKEKSSGVFFVKANALKLPFRNECFDVVFGHGIFHHIPDLDAAFKESFRVLKKGGTLVALEPNMMSINGFYYYTRRLMHRLLGFKRLTKVVGFVTPEEKYLNALTLKRKLRKEFRDVDVYTISLIRLPPVGRIKKLNIEPLNRVLDLMFSWIPFNYFGSFCVLKAKK